MIKPKDNFDVRSLRTAIDEANELLAEAEAQIGQLNDKLRACYMSRAEASKRGPKPVLDILDFRCIFDMLDNGVSQAGIARGMDISKATVCRFLKRKYPGAAAQQAWVERDVFIENKKRPKR